MGTALAGAYAEIRAAANLVQIIAIGVSIVGLLIAAVLSWFLSGYLTRSLSAVVTASRRMAAGEFDARVEMGTGFKPAEINELGLSFNVMADVIDKTNIDLSKVVEAANVANRSKSEFLANMSHELRTPLNAIIGFSDVIRTETYGPLGNDKYKEYVSDIQHSGRHLLELINDVLDVSVIESGKLELNDIEVDLNQIVAASLQMVKSRADLGGVQLINSVNGEASIIRADELRMKQILVNLLSNAVKFTKNGGTASVSTEIADDDSVLIVVADTGIGMDDADIAKALEKFGQTERGDLMQSGEGTGLGLPLTKGLVEAHGGKLEISSVPSIGTTVTIHIPRERVLNIDENQMQN